MRDGSGALQPRTDVRGFVGDDHVEADQDVGVEEAEEVSVGLFVDDCALMRAVSSFFTCSTASGGICVVPCGSVDTISLIFRTRVRLNAPWPAFAALSVSQFSSISATTTPTNPEIFVSGSPTSGVVLIGSIVKVVCPIAGGIGTLSPVLTSRVSRFPWLPGVARNVEEPSRKNSPHAGRLCGC